MRNKQITLSSGRNITIFDDVFPFDKRDHMYRKMLKSTFKLDGNDGAYPEHKSDQQIYAQCTAEDVFGFGFLESENIQHILEHHVGKLPVAQARVNVNSTHDVVKFHVDAMNGKTLLYFANINWHPDWGGHTLFSDDQVEEVEYCSMFKPGRVVLFDGSIPHCTGLITNAAKVYRITFLIQFYPPLGQST